MKQGETNVPDLGDLLKVAACSAVILQTILGFAVHTSLSVGQQAWVIAWYDLMKFSAPAFIFAILFSTMRTTSSGPLGVNYLPYLQKQWSLLFLPTALWSAVYLILMPSLQSHHPYHNLTSFNWQFVTGNGAPHLWYSTMMLQFIVLMPVFVWLTRWLTGSPRRQGVVLTVSAVGYVWWIALYTMFVFNGPAANRWYLMDRLLPSFFIYGLLGILTWLNYERVLSVLMKRWWVLLIPALWGWLCANTELHSFGATVSFENAPYLKPSMLMYSVSVIGLLCALGGWLLLKTPRVMRVIHRLAVYAYQAFLGHVFWVALLWWIESRLGWQGLLGLRVGVTYLVSWVVSFGSVVAWREVGNHQK
ncbi:acyltransferase [Furfurilactobacillus siliginis]|uniref:Membrane protein n=1 Tax=Furfurilactobacillus siliginis TaxID=348151 RepID=A0A0R2L5X9_9LACO|nr:acyltransferase [Furfurilactobacillus siliginis]KRN97208.1 integral membrane protein [Furfurilactobacillus siliginis]GEK29319.1 membrane protein [Furfurilactobacillus siliginis]